MSFRFLLLATAAGFAFASPAFALDRDSDFDMLELAQAAPPAAAAAGRTFSPKSMCLDSSPAASATAPTSRPGWS